ncbi:uncharacterized protein CLAFUR5_14638 [Fulvia fulva]|uniref:Uncharacterized protein n=1 Tax=Passalora fulva TaxID=5499 RepID=A0A9Q8PMZ1_PASFU|nr:uncharacterized protein CLAFUR5_14638 [Fulvia fulva]KAK4608895.1 hypothetical protein CLAFUR0_14848 [Fulvia fulva]UJO25423.1 hypothetical protein CLAFUR5_14638 [Fulvia fulva]
MATTGQGYTYGLRAYTGAQLLARRDPPNQNRPAFNLTYDSTQNAELEAFCVEHGLGGTHALPIPSLLYELTNNLHFLHADEDHAVVRELLRRVAKRVEGRKAVRHDIRRQGGFWDTAEHGPVATLVEAALGVWWDEQRAAQETYSMKLLEKKAKPAMVEDEDLEQVQGSVPQDGGGKESQKKKLKSQGKVQQDDQLKSKSQGKVKQEDQLKSKGNGKGKQDDQLTGKGNGKGKQDDQLTGKGKDKDKVKDQAKQEQSQRSPPQDHHADQAKQDEDRGPYDDDEEHHHHHHHHHAEAGRSRAQLLHDYQLLRVAAAELRARLSELELSD